ncbi:MAG TPA: RDD family protein [Thermoanaerobaculia bacterium]|jgi:uncharacterized RDD family membrane protein YckC
MRRPQKPDEPSGEPLLFDLPLSGRDEEPPAEPERKRPARESRAPAPPELPLPRPVPVPVPERRSETAAPASERAGRGSRFAAGLADLVVHAAVAVAALLGVRWLGVRPALSDWPALAVFLLSFSFLYTVLPLAFWGYTLGMAWAGITARNRSGEPLTFDQTARRWLGGLLTAALLGMPLLLTGSRRSMTDVISGSATYPEKDE